MRIKLTNLHLDTKKQGIDVSLDSFNYFHGPISTGKSTIGRLIMYCFGRNLKETPALKNEFLSVTLSLEIEDYSIVIERAKSSQKLIVSYRKLDSNDPESIIIPARSIDGPSAIPGKNIFNMSDLLFYFSGIKPPKVRRSKIKEDTELVRLGFRDLLWYCYLSQEEMDSSFFYLGKDEADFSKRLKSKDVMRYVLGYYQEKVSLLETKLVETRQKQVASRESSDQITQILFENKIDNTENILNEISELKIKLTETRKQIKSKKKLNSNPIGINEELRSERRYIERYIQDLQNSLDEINKQTSTQTNLRREFMMAMMKSKRIRISMDIFSKAEFEFCPNCSSIISKKSSNNHDKCYLCKEGPNGKTILDVDSELKERTEELKNSLEKFDESRRDILSKIEKYTEKKREIEAKINQIEEQDDSEFLFETSTLLKDEGIISGEINALEKLLPLPKKADELKDESYQLESEILKIKDQLKTAREDAEKNRQSVNLLKDYFLDNLKRANFPKIENDYEVIFNTKDFLPMVKPKDEGDLGIIDFFNAGSGGKQTLFKTCFALAMHRLSVKTNNSLPSLLIIDSPMKNIGKEEDIQIFNGFHKLIYDLAVTELKNTQILLIGTNYLEPNTKPKLKINERRMTRQNNSDSPPLITYYSGQ